MAVMSDAAHNWTDGQLDKLEKVMAREYGQAASEMKAKQKRFMANFAKEKEQRERALDNTKEALKAHDEWLKEQAISQSWLKDMVATLSDDAVKANVRAAEAIRGQIPNVYAENANWAAYGIEKATGGIKPFALVDADAARGLMLGKRKLLPRVDEAKDMRWNRQKFTSVITQGVLQGESMDDIGKRIEQVMGMNARSALRVARTAVTSAENAGRLDSYERAKSMGINVQIEWMATLDDRTRESHAMLDGQRVEVGEEFENGCKFPGDPDGDPSEVYNCRCTTVPYIPDIDYGEDWRQNARIGGMSYDEWKASKVSGGKVLESEHAVVDGQSILGSWQRRPDQFDFEIEDVLNAQGFGGLPRVVSADEFDRAVKQANGGDGLVMQRSYSAPTQEILDAYSEMLYDGKWYVDCSTGGAQYGQGMYCAADYTGMVTSGMREEMVHYHRLNAERLGGVATTDEYKLGLIDDYVLRMAGTAEQKEATRTYLQVKAGVGNPTAEAKRAVKESLSRDSMRVLDTQASVIQQAREGSFTRIETMTLDPSAKIIEFNDINREWDKAVSEAQSSIENSVAKKLFENTGDSELVDYGKAMMSNDDDRIDEAVRWLQTSATDMQRATVDDVFEKMNGEINRRMYALGHIEIGSRAAMMGYDAINAVGHGASGSYTVVLNRTKLIIRRP